MEDFWKECEGMDEVLTRVQKCRGEAKEVWWKNMKELNEKEVKKEENIKEKEELSEKDKESDNAMEEDKESDNDNPTN
eukprot:11303175-Ditylum_brightwellii.AAC.1